MLAFYPKGELHLMLNAYHSKGLDVLFRYFTMLATWPPFVIAVLVGLLYKAGWGVYMLMTELVSGLLVVQPIKWVMNMPRPLAWFAQEMPDVVLPIADGVQMHQWMSFPSGHTKTFFCMMLCLCVVLHASGKLRPRAEQVVEVVLALLAIAGGYSRIYLSLHFALDVEAGAIIGIIFPVIGYMMIVHYGWEKQKWFEWNIESSSKNG